MHRLRTLHTVHEILEATSEEERESFDSAAWHERAVEWIQDDRGSGSPAEAVRWSRDYLDGARTFAATARPGLAVLGWAEGV